MSKKLYFFAFFPCNYPIMLPVVVSTIKIKQNLLQTVKRFVFFFFANY